jgi:RNase P/RNase MRP subunit p29
MKAIKEGQIVKFHSPLTDENPNQLYVVLEVIEDKEKSRAEIQALNTTLTFPPINKVKLDDLEVVEVATNDLIGHKVTINKSDYSQIEGRVIKTSKEKIELNMSRDQKGIQTNVWLTVIDNNGTEHFGTLLINQ